MKASSLVLVAFAAGLAAPAASAGMPVASEPAVVQASPAAADMLKGIFDHATVQVEPARSFAQYFKRSFCRFNVKRAAA
jgi:hypothetical protein